MGQSLSSRANYEESGAALILFVFLLMITVTTFFVNQLNNTAIYKIHEQQTADALAKAKAALIGYAIGNTSTPGGLPCPDTNNDGTAEPSCSSSNLIGYFPWKTLGMEMLKDGSGECLLYALSPVFRSSLGSRTAANGLQIKLNTPPAITLMQFTSSSTVNLKVIAVIISPGPILTGQTRTVGTSTTCSNYVSGYSDFLDTDQNINNATGSPTGTGNAKTLKFIQSLSANNNDQFQYITHKDLFIPLVKRVFFSAAGLVNTPTSGLYYYYDNHASYPFAASSFSSGTSTDGDTSDYFPYNNNQLIFNLESWIFNTNDWKTDVHYEIGSNFINNSIGSVYQVYCQNSTITCLQVHKGYRVPTTPAFLSVPYTDLTSGKQYLLEIDI